MGFGEEVKKILADTQILINEPMNRHTTFQVGGCAAFLLKPKADQIADILSLCRRFDVPYFCLGRGSNLLVSDLGYDGVVISIGQDMADISVSGDTIVAGAGASLAGVAMAALNSSLSGMEFASGIPGSVGGGLVMNAGAYGGELKDVVVSAKVLSENGEILTLLRDEMDLSYRHSMMQDKGYIILEATFRLRAGDKDEIKALMDDLNGRRREKQPLEYASAGSTFKRPEGYFAGKLIEDAGLKGFSIGGAAVSDKHCGFVINKGNATAKDITDVMEECMIRVQEEFGVTLVPEVRMLGNFL